MTINVSDTHIISHDISEFLKYPLGGNIYIHRLALVFTSKSIYILKPRQRRFWLTSSAYTDADKVMGHLLHSADAERRDT